MNATLITALIRPRNSGAARSHRMGEGRGDALGTAQLTRRDFMKKSALAAGGIGIATLPEPAQAVFPKRQPLQQPPFRISLAEWSLHRALFGGKMVHLDFPKVAKQEYGIAAIELVNQFFKDKAKDEKYLAEFKQRADDLGVKTLLIMCDGEGMLGDADAAKRRQAVQNHHQWVDAAKVLGCHSIRVNAHSTGSYEEQLERTADGFHALSGYAAGAGLNVLVENHGGFSANGTWLTALIKKVNRPNCGMLPDFGNFHAGDGTDYDRYKGVAEMMPYAKAVSAKSNDFDASGNEIHTDYRRMLTIVLHADYHGHVGIEYEGEKLSEPEGIRATKALLDKVLAEFSRPSGPQRQLS
jgi:L-ribulose-5-phosphate 3-epimerase